MKDRYWKQLEGELNRQPERPESEQEALRRQIAQLKVELAVLDAEPAPAAFEGCGLPLGQAVARLWVEGDQLLFHGATGRQLPSHRVYLPEAWGARLEVGRLVIRVKRKPRPLVSAGMR